MGQHVSVEIQEICPIVIFDIWWDISTLLNYRMMDDISPIPNLSYDSDDDDDDFNVVENWIIENAAQFVIRVWINDIIRSFRLRIF